MNSQLLETLSQISQEEQRILDGNPKVEQARYTSRREFVVDSRRMLEQGKLIAVRTHTRFIDFPMHRHNYIEVMYVCKGQITHEINNCEVVMQEGDLLFLNQHTSHAVRAAGKEDIGINLLILPEFFDMALAMLERNNVLADFLVDFLRKNSTKNQYLHFQLAGNLQIDNILENLVYSLVNKQNSSIINQTLMELLFLYLLQNTNTLREDAPSNYEDVMIRTVKQYIYGHYKTASLTQLAQNMNYSLSQLSRFIKKKTGYTFKELLQQRRFAVAKSLLQETKLSVSDIVLAVGYENNSYFHRKFKENYRISPKEYRLQQQSSRYLE